MNLTKLKNVKFRYDYVTICYGRDGHRLYQGEIENIPEHLLEYYVCERIDNKVRHTHYIEVIEDEKWFN